MPRLFRIVTIIIVIFLSCILFFELIFGNWIKQDPFYRLNVIRNQTFTFDISGLYRSENGLAVYRRDKYGLRGDYGKPSDIALLTVGGSTTDQRYIDENLTWQAVLQNTFASTGKEISIANAGCDGQASFGYIKNFEYWFPNIPGLKPHFVLFNIGLLDLNRKENESYDRILSKRQKRSFKILILENSALYDLVRMVYRYYQAEVKREIGHQAVDYTKIVWVKDSLRHDHQKLIAKRLEAYGKRLEVLVDQCEALGAKPVFMTQTTRRYRMTKDGVEGIEHTVLYDGVPVNGVDFYYLMNLINGVTRDVALKHDVLLFDAANEITWEDGDFYDLAHMNPQGTRKLGLYLYDRLNLFF